MNKRILCMLLVACALPGCHRKAEGQTVAVVNDQEITAGELNAELGTNNSNGDTKAARAAALQRLVDRKLLVEQAESDGLDKSPEYLDQQRRMSDELLINMLVSRRLKTSQVPTADEISKYEASHPQMFANRETWTLDQLLYPPPKDQSLTPKLAAAKSLDEIQQILTAAGIQYKRANNKLDTAALPQQVYNQIEKLPATEPFIVNGPNESVASVITSRQPNPTSADQASQLALNAMKRDQAQQIVSDRLKSLRGSAKIEYQPGFEPPKK